MKGKFKFYMFSRMKNCVLLYQCHRVINQQPFQQYLFDRFWNFLNIPLTMGGYQCDTFVHRLHCIETFFLLLIQWLHCKFPNMKLFTKKQCEEMCLPFHKCLSIREFFIHFRWKIFPKF